MNRKEFIWLGATVLVFIIIFFFEDVLMSFSTNVTCAKVVGIHSGRNMDYIEYEYIVAEKVVRVDKSVLSFKIRDLDSLKKLDCIKIEYSTIWNIHNRIIDKRVAAQDN